MKRKSRIGGFSIQKMALAALAAAAGAVSLAAFYGEMRAGETASGTVAGTEDIPALAGLSGSEALAEAALMTRPADLDLAREATLKTLRLDPASVTALNRLSYIDLAANGHITRDGLAALYRSYEVSPYGREEVMTWRVDFASRVWSSLPDDLREKTLAQIPVIGRMPTTWDWRVETCRNNPHAAIYEAVCRTAPGTVNAHSGYRVLPEEVR